LMGIASLNPSYNIQILSSRSSFETRLRKRSSG
jgi:hypothetical protein